MENGERPVNDGYSINHAAEVYSTVVLVPSFLLLEQSGLLHQILVMIMSLP